MFATTYVCEKLFSRMKIVKIKFRSRMTDKYLRDQLRLAGKGQLSVDMLNKLRDFSRKFTLFVSQFREEFGDDEDISWCKVSKNPHFKHSIEKYTSTTFADFNSNSAVATKLVTLKVHHFYLKCMIIIFKEENEFLTFLSVDERIFTSASSSAKDVTFCGTDVVIM
ncbi:hypothetical protein ANN_01093 [Periplaneta americana]|uniref:HAT C-terminal dimerisation domain-containing protein n=1 Tax=Periplaneta americana TaxID=6978 RepID=A0ABQ8TVV8_PERAM|nr:hypothetical protein ANN_01093 [Periplaneta americana]